MDSSDQQDRTSNHDVAQVQGLSSLPKRLDNVIKHVEDLKFTFMRKESS